MSMRRVSMGAALAIATLAAPVFAQDEPVQAASARHDARLTGDKGLRAGRPTSASDSSSFADGGSIPIAVAAAAAAGAGVYFAVHNRHDHPSSP